MLSIILKVIEWLVFLALLVVLFLAASPLLPTKNIVATYVVSSGSMEPVIATGSVVITTPIDASQVKVGNVVTFLSPVDSTQTVIHRVVEIETDNEGIISFRTKGDNNDSIDNWTVPQDNILGLSRSSLPYLGYLISFLKTPMGFIVGIGVPALLLMIAQALK